ncbi:type I secretion system permease/ATPase [Sneathiella glossodoripedis]|uniref:type I secretion system permease/ATPase n=1 Tax=Sneathiella glossodoripedis TaxID=418853 RepID=UPI00046E72E6|nr:type I secretion system permease/ATPase [Sneathiella glossodoripedis]
MSEEVAPVSAPDTGLACLVLLLKYLGIAVDPEQVRHQYSKAGEPLSRTDILRCAKQLGVKARSTKTKWSRLEKIHLPAIAENHAGEYVILAKVAEDQVLIQDPQEGRPTTLTREEFEASWSGRLILLTTRAQEVGEDRRFDFTWFIPSIVRFRRLFGEVLIASFFIQIFALITPMFFQVVIDKVLVHKGLSTLDVLVFGLITVTIFEVLMGGLRTYVLAHTTNRMDVELGAKLFRHVLALPIAYFQSRRVGLTVARVRELESIREFLTGHALSIVMDLLFAFVFLGVMYFYSSTLTWVVIASFPFYIAVTIAITPILRKRLLEKFARGAENQAFLVESISGVETIKSMAVEPQMQRRWEEQLAGYVGAGFRVNWLANIGSQSIQLINKLTTAATLWFGAQLVIDGDISVGQFIAFNMLANRLTQPILRLSQMWQDFQQVRVSVERLGDIINTPAEPAYRPGRVRPPSIEGRVSFDHVSFRYRPDRPPVLNSLVMDVQPGEVVGIVGRSGSGKSTLAKLLQRLYVPETGRTLIDGTDVSMVDPAWLRRQVGVVPQENILFSRSVRDNIALSDPTIPMERVIAAAKLAGAHDFILELAEGYDTEIEERGLNLSGGQRQRIAIARALVNSPRILIFDEATSALDAESEEIIQQNMAQIVKGRTTFIIAHRMSALRDATRIISMEGGRIVEDGPPKELLKQNGLFRSLYDKQLGGLEDA